jgi:hypothetical protein
LLYVEIKIIKNDFKRKEPILISRVVEKSSSTVISVPDMKKLELNEKKQKFARINSSKPSIETKQSDKNFINLLGEAIRRNKIITKNPNSDKAIIFCDPKKKYNSFVI